MLCILFVAIGMSAPAMADLMRCSLFKWTLVGGELEHSLIDKQALNVVTPQTIYQYSNEEIKAYGSYFEAAPGVQSFEMILNDLRSSSTARYRSLEKYHKLESVMNHHDLDPEINSYELECSLMEQ